MPKKKKRRGHYCWACDRHRANERFTGHGHARHICRDCQKLGAQELAYRQALRNLARCVTWDGIIPRKRRKTFSRFLEHPDPRIRELAQHMALEDAKNRQMLHDDFAMDPIAGDVDESLDLTCATDDAWAE